MLPFFLLALPAARALLLLLPVVLTFLPPLLLLCDVAAGCGGGCEGGGRHSTPRLLQWLQGTCPCRLHFCFLYPASSSPDASSALAASPKLDLLTGPASSAPPSKGGATLACGKAMLKCGEAMPGSEEAQLWLGEALPW